MTLEKTVRELKQRKEVIAAYLFGSYDTPRQNPLSDIDLCLFTKKIDNKTLLNLYSYGSKKLDLSLFDTLPPAVQMEVFKGRPLFIKDKYFVAEKFAKSYRQYQDFRKYQEAYWKQLKERTKKIKK
ncbi:MAG TPA: nucleotidyltransferase domain-containing protein [Candidatus Nanoarchaeia archaeon]|nr:nucleotidyltransferase domain-containing protein [Candidatus Nanoarchaeia archaeon]